MSFNIYSIMGELVVLADKTAELLYVQDYFNGMKYHGKIIDTLRGVLTNSGQSAYGARFLQCVESLLDCQEAKDYIGMADCYVMQLKPLCLQVIDELRQDGIWQEVKDYYSVNYAASDEVTKAMLDSIQAEEEDIPEGYELVETSVGSFSLKVKGISGISLYFSSTNNPYDEADRIVNAYCGECESAARVSLLGLGMGYVSQALAKRDDIMFTNVYETDKYVIKAAFHYANLVDMLKSGRVNVVYDPQLTAFSKSLSDKGDEGDVGKSKRIIIIHRPSMMNIANENLREKFSDFFLHDSSVRSQRRLLYGNFARNVCALDVKGLESVRDDFADKQVLFIAGGPSFDDHIDMLAESARDYVVTIYDADGVHSVSLNENIPDESEDYVVVCVGTVLKRLLSYGIKPDYVVMTDPQDNMINQISGVDTSDLKLVFLSTLSSNVVSAWKGQKYMALQKGFEPAEMMAEQQGSQLFSVGGSVSTLAIDMLIRFGCEKVLCMGLDLAYVDSKRHSGDRKGILTEAQLKGLRQVTSVAGSLVETADNLDNYRLWIERRLASRKEEEKKVELINVSRGAFINGMVNRTQL